MIKVLDIEVPLKLDVRTSMFEAEFGGQRFMSKDGQEVKNNIIAAIESAAASDFKPVICLSIGDTNRWGELVEFERYYVFNKQLLSWDLFDPDNPGRNLRNSSRNYGPDYEKMPWGEADRGTYAAYLPYRDELWKLAGMLDAGLKAELLAMQVMLEDLVENGHVDLSAVLTVAHLEEEL
jgi:hypothetical protein